MNFKEYQEDAKKTSIHKSWVYPYLGLASEAGEVAAIGKRVIRDGTAINRDELTDELGDVLWYVAEVASWNNIDLDTVAIMNIDKLKKRMAENKIVGKGKR